MTWTLQVTNRMSPAQTLCVERMVLKDKGTEEFFLAATKTAAAPGFWGQRLIPAEATESRVGLRATCVVSTGQCQLRVCPCRGRLLVVTVQPPLHLPTHRGDCSSFTGTVRATNKNSLAFPSLPKLVCTFAHPLPLPSGPVERGASSVQNQSSLCALDPIPLLPLLDPHHQLLNVSSNLKTSPPLAAP